jgi:hypothetical protein
MRTEKLQFKTSNRILRTYKNFPYKPWYAIAELVDNSTQSYFNNREVLDAAYQDEASKDGRAGKRVLEVRIAYDPQQRLLSVWDNAMGMSRTELQLGILLAEPPQNRTGRSEFGMGLKTSCSWLGAKWKVETKKLGEVERYAVTVDVESFQGNAGEDELDVLVYENEEASQHFTLVEISELHHEFKGNRLRKIKDYLVSMYRVDIRNGDLILKWDGVELTPPEVQPLTVTEDGVTRTWKRDIDFAVQGKQVKGVAMILGDGFRGRGQAGFDLIRRGRVVVGRPGGYRPEVIFGESRNDLTNQRLYGELRMDEFPVNHLKDDFLWEEFQDEFDEALNRECTDILAYMKTLRVRGKKGVSPEARDMADAAVADELTSDEMVRLLEFLSIANPPEPRPEEIVVAEAEALREMADAYRETQSGRFRIRIYHLKSCAPERKYMTFVSSDPQVIDVFINDRHPFIERVIEESPKEYEIYVKTCVYDALAEWIARKIPSLSPDTITYFKDQLMRGPGLEPVSK